MITIFNSPQSHGHFMLYSKHKMAGETGEILDISAQVMKSLLTSYILTIGIILQYVGGDIMHRTPV